MSTVQAPEYTNFVTDDHEIDNEDSESGQEEVTPSLSYSSVAANGTHANILGSSQSSKDDLSINSNDCDEHFAHFDSDILRNTTSVYDDIKIKSRVDDNGWEYYVFDSGENELLSASQYLSVVVFPSKKHTLVNINGVVLPLSEFLDITHLDDKSSIAAPEKKITDLRSVPNQNAIKCTTTTGSFSIPNASIPVIMKAMSVLIDNGSDDFKKETVASPDSLLNYMGIILAPLAFTMGYLTSSPAPTHF
jgi:hypothetical protein